MNISVFKPSIKRRDMDAVLNCMVSDRIGFGKSAARLVSEVSEYVGVKGGAAFKEYFRALKTAVCCLELEQGAKVGVSALAPQMYEAVLSELGLEAVVLDVDPNSALISLPALSEASGGLDAVIINYEMGFLPDMEKIAELEVPVIEDISMAFGADYGEKKAGSFGKYAVINMDEDGMITSGGGALVLASGRKEKQVLKSVTEQLHPSVFLPDMNAVLGSMQLKYIEEFIASRREVSEIFSKALMRSRHKKLVQGGDLEGICYSFPVVLETGMQEVSAYAMKKNILTEAAFSRSIAAYSEDVQRDCPEAKALMLRCVNFPLYPMLGKKNIAEISKVLSSLP